MYIQTRVHNNISDEGGKLFIHFSKIYYYNCKLTHFGRGLEPSLCVHYISIIISKLTAMGN